MCWLCESRADSISLSADAMFVPEPLAGASFGRFAIGQPLTGNAAVDGLLSGVKWNGLGLTFSFPRGTFDLPFGYGQEVFAPVTLLSASHQDAVFAALTQQYAAVAPMGFTFIAPDAAANIRFAVSPLPSTSYAYYPGSLARNGDVWFGSGDFSSTTQVIRGTYYWATVLHEIGHALGLKHQHEGGTLAPFQRQSIEFSIMSYSSYVGDDSGGGYHIEPTDFPTTLMQDDIRAIQTMYGANWAFRSGATRYQFEPLTGELYVDGVRQGTPAGNRIFLTLWDGGGDDTYDLSNYATPLSIDLTPGAWSAFDPNQLARLGDGNAARGNLANAFQVGSDTRSLIENAVGGSGDDRLLGNAVANRLTGNSGQDVLYGDAGNDQLAGNAGDDVLFGASGRDTAYYFTLNAAQASWTRRGDGWVTLSAGAEGTDYLLSVEQLRFADRLVSLTPPLPRDLDGDSVSDLIIYQSSTNSFAMRLSGANPALLPSPAFGARVAATGDFDGDGAADLLWRDAGGLVATRPGGAPLGAALAAPGANWVVAGTGDFNGDGKSDLLWREAGGTIVLWFMDGGRVSGGGTIGNPGASWNVAGVGDLNGDGRSDILWRNSDGTVWSWLLDGVGIAGNGGQATPGSDWAIRGVGDLDGDGRADVVWRNTGGLVYGWLMNGPVADRWGAIGNPGPAYDVSAVADGNADDRADILFQGPGGLLYEWYMAGLAVASHGPLNSLPFGWTLVA